MTKRRNFSDKFKAAVSLEALRGDKTVQEIAAKRQLHPTQVSTWKRQALDWLACSQTRSKRSRPKTARSKSFTPRLLSLRCKMIFVTRVEAMSPSDRRDMIRKENTNLSLTRQCKLLKISRSSIYYTPVGFDQATIDLMHEIDRIFKKYPFFGSCQIAAYLLQSGFSAGRHRVRRLMGVMGLQAIYKGPNTSNKHPEHRMYPCLLRKLPIT